MQALLLTIVHGSGELSRVAATMTTTAAAHRIGPSSQNPTAATPPDRWGTAAHLRRADAAPVQDNATLATLSTASLHPAEQDGLLPEAAALRAPAPALPEPYRGDDPSLVLLAEDDEDILALVSLRLERAGYRVARARNGREAVELARDLRPAVAVFDVSMPLMTGVDAIRTLRGEPATAGLPIILLTARNSESEISAGTAAGASAYITKPFSPQDLAARIAALLGNG
jgi:CheY-like chemotaxis protein